MNYECIEKPAFKMIGIACRTSNSPEKGPIDIPKLWEVFFKNNTIDLIPNKISREIIALYCNYESDHTGNYTLILGCPVNSIEEVPEDMIAKDIPSRKYAHFKAIGEHPQELIKTWQDIWQNNSLQRKYEEDCELYDENFLISPNEVNLLISIK